MTQNLIGNTFDSQFQQFGIPKSIAASDIYLSQDTIFKKIFYIKKGILRSFYVTEKGEEKTVFFRWEGQITAVPECIFDNEPTRQNWQALEDCELLEIDFALIEKVSENNAVLLKKRLAFSQKMLLEALQRVESFVLDKPEERYLKLKAQKPEIIQSLFHLQYRQTTTSKEPIFFRQHSRTSLCSLHPQKCSIRIESPV